MEQKMKEKKYERGKKNWRPIGTTLLLNCNPVNPCDRRKCSRCKTPANGGVKRSRRSPQLLSTTTEETGHRETLKFHLAR